MIPEAFREVQLIRAGTAVLLLGCISFTYAPWFERRMQQVLIIPPLIAGFAVTVMSVVGQQASEYYHYYAGLILVLMYVHVLLRLHFVVASAVGNVLIAVFLATNAWLGTPAAALWNTAFFLVAANATGMIASYALERYARQAFLQARRQERTNNELATVLDGLRTAQSQLIQQEKMASLGRLTAGVAHEIKNPLNFVNNFAGLSVDLADEIAESLHGDAPSRTTPALLADLRQNVARIREHGQRADRIVRGMLEHAGATRGARQSLSVNSLVEEHVALMIDAFRQRHPTFDARVVLELDDTNPVVEIVPREIERVVEVLVDNALQAVHDRKGVVEGATHGDGAPYEPTVVIRTLREAGAVRIEVQDNGVGIPEELHHRVFEPFFTTRPAGAGTGLDLSLAYEFVVHGHGGTIAYESEEGVGTTFTVTLEDERVKGEG